MCIPQRVNNTASASALHTSSCASDQRLQPCTETDAPGTVVQDNAVTLACTSLHTERNNSESHWSELWKLTKTKPRLA